MATFNAKIKPFAIPTHAILELPGGSTADVAMDKLNEEQLLELADEFTRNLFKMAKKELPT